MPKRGGMRAGGGLLLLLLLLVVPRIVALDADAWPRLDWSTGIWTDEGFYTYNARNAVLFGKAELDEFNNRNLAPILDAVQRRVFTRFGVGLVQARMISVVCSLLALAFFYDALRRIWGRRIAVTGLLFLGAEAMFIQYNRLALLETPSVLWLCIALWALTLGTPAGWLLAGALAAGAIAWKTTFLLFLPVPLLAWLWRRVGDGGSGGGAHGVMRPAACYGAGAVVGAALYLALWGIPHGREIVRMNNYYRTAQTQPRSVRQALFFAERAFWGYRIGSNRPMLQYLETRAPVLTTLAILGLLTVPLGRTKARLSVRAARRRDLHRVFWLWVALGLAMLSILRYSPSRYYLTLYPAIAGLAAITLWRLPLLWRWARARQKGRWAALVICLPAFLLLYHLCVPVLYVLRVPLYEWVGRVLAAFLAFLLMYRLILRLRRLVPVRSLAVGGLALFLVVSLAQWAHWYATRTYYTRDLGREMAAIVRPEGVVLGDWAANLCLDNRLRGVPVLYGLANWRDPVQRLRAEYVLVFQTPFRILYWNRTAPEVVRPENQVRAFTIHDYRFRLYRVPPAIREKGDLRAAAVGTFGVGAPRERWRQ